MSSVKMTLNWIPISKLKNHPLNAEVFGELRPGDVADDAEFLDSIKEHGIQTPLVLTESYEIISGHRRRQAAARLKLGEVPAIIRRDLGNNRISINRAWLEANQQREKNTEQKARWAKFRLEIEEAEAKARQKAALKHGGSVPVPAILPERAKPAETSEKRGEAMEVVAEEVGMSRHTLEKAIEVTEAIDAAEESGDEDKAEELREALNGKSVAAAHRLAVPAKTKKKRSKQKAAKPAALVHEIGKAVGTVSRTTRKAADKHGEGTHFKAIWSAITEIKKSVEAWEKELCK